MRHEHVTPRGGRHATWPRPVWSSPITVGILLVVAANAAWFVLFLLHTMIGDPTYAFPEGLRSFIAARSPGRVDLSFPMAVLYNAAMIAAPVLLLGLPSVQYAATCTATLVSSGRRRWYSTYAAAGLLVLLTIVLADHTRLPFLNERVRWATDWFPLPIPLDPPLLVRAEHLLTRIVDARYTFVGVNLCVHVGLLAYLWHYFGRRRALVVPVTLGYMVAVTSFRSVYFMNGAEAELPAAALGLIGLLETRRRHHMNALLAFTGGLLFKVTAGFFAVPALILIVADLLRHRLSISSLPWRTAIVAFGIIALNYAGYVLNVVVLRGGSYVLQGSGQPFFAGSLGAFVGEFVAAYPVQTAISLVAMALSPQRLFLTGLAICLLALRSVASVAGGYYTTFFVPLWTLLAAGLFVQLWEAKPDRRRLVVTLGAFALIGNALLLVALPNKSDWVTRANTSWDERIATMARELPPGTLVFFRKLSPRYDLERSGRRDLTFREMPEDTVASKEILARPGPVLYVAPGDDIKRIGPGEIGYTQLGSRFGGSSEFGFYLKRD